MMKKVKRILWPLLIALVVLIAGGIVYLKATAYQPTTAAKTAEKSAQSTTNSLYFPSDDHQKPLVVFYPGALVTPASYSIWAQQVAAAGYPVYIAKFPLNLAVLSPNVATKILNGSKRDYVIGGHSLGGVMASRYAKNHDDQQLKGVFYMASYPDEKGRLDQTKLPVLSLTASRDGVLNWSNYEKAKKYLPTTTNYQQIKGGNHGGFGSYGQQKGDHSAMITNAAQQKQVAQDLIAWLNQLNQ